MSDTIASPAVDASESQAIRRHRVAAALKYQLGQAGLPVVSATGKGAFAEQIVALAKEKGIPIREDADLAELLAAIAPGTEIPPEAVLAVAEILGRLYRINNRRKRSNR